MLIRLVEDFSDPCQYDFGRRSFTQVCVDPLAENYFPMADVNSVFITL